MKLFRNTTTDANPDLRGRKHYFTIENAPATVLEVMDNMLTAAGWENDTCPLYDEGISCGWWIDISEVDQFKAAYKEAKAGIKAGGIDARVQDVEAAHSEALEMNEAKIDEAHARQYAWKHSYSDEYRTTLLEAYHEIALENNAEIDNIAEFAGDDMPVQENGDVNWIFDAAVVVWMNRRHAEALLENESRSTSNTDISAPLRIISDYMLRFMRNNREAKLFEAKARLESKIIQFVADGFNEQCLRLALSAATGSYTREAFADAFKGEE
ncbi:TPA: DUF5417 domain-containing protein [Enterobacter hormaechei subsp. xiangfangensis]